MGLLGLINSVGIMKVMPSNRSLANVFGKFNPNDVHFAVEKNRVDLK